MKSHIRKIYIKFFKRIFDFLFSLIFLILLSPIFFVVAILIKLDDGGSVFFKQNRVGQNWKIFKIYKFRTMIENAEKIGSKITTNNDKRITRIGKILRKYKIDELPQLINVIKGEMSIVGPRPEVPKYAKIFKDDYDIILQVKPGITDYASIKFKDENKLLNCDNPEKIYIEKILPEKIKLYKLYLRKISFLTDLKIILLTLIEIFFD